MLHHAAMTILRRGLLLAALACTPACGEHINADGQCVEPRSACCPGGSCPSIDEARGCADTGSTLSETTCDGMTVIGCSDQGGWTTTYFDAAGGFLARFRLGYDSQTCESLFSPGTYGIWCGEPPAGECGEQ